MNKIFAPSSNTYCLIFDSMNLLQILLDTETFVIYKLNTMTFPRNYRNSYKYQHKIHRLFKIPNRWHSGFRLKKIIINYKLVITHKSCTIFPICCGVDLLFHFIAIISEFLRLLEHETYTCPANIQNFRIVYVYYKSIILWPFTAWSQLNE